MTYKSRFLGSDCYQANNEQSRIVVAEFGTVAMPDPCKNVFQRFLSRFEMPSESRPGPSSFLLGIRFSLQLASLTTKAIMQR